MLEDYYGLYRNSWFLVAKKALQKGKISDHRLINAYTEMNKVTFKDVGIPLNLKEFIKEFTDMATASVLNYFSGYD